MPVYRLTYARVVILETEIEAIDEDAAWNQAILAEHHGELGLEDWQAKDGSTVRDVDDYEEVWNLEVIGKSSYDEINEEEK